MNAINIIAPYKHLGLWVFDDEKVGLIEEPFVGGADTIIDTLVAGIPNAEAGFRAIFSADAFPGYNVRLEWVRAETNGNVYRCTEVGMEGWLCPALLKYFEAPPHEIYVKVEPLPEPVRANGI